MSDADDIDGCVRKRFDDVTRSELVAAFVEAYRAKGNCDMDDAENCAEVFVASLGWFADYPCKDPEKQEQRREKVEAFANRLDRLIEAAFALDDPALGYTLHSGLTELVSRGDFDDEDRASVEAVGGWRAVLGAYDIQHRYRADISRFCLGVRKAIKALPPLDKNFYVDEFQVAKFIEDYLGRLGIPCTTSDTGLAGRCFLATMALCGKEKSRAGYWLKKAVDHEDSWSNFVKRMAQKKTPAE